MNKEKRLGLIVICITVFVCYFLLEIYVEMFEPQANVIYEPDENIGFKHIPNKDIRVPGDEFPTNYFKVNSQGFIDKEYSFEKPEGVYRIVILGDSFTEAITVPFEKSYHYLLEEKLGSDYEVISFGVSAFSTDQEVMTLKSYALQYHPDLVILAFFAGNDVKENYFDKDRLWKRYYTLEGSELVLGDYTVKKPNPFLIFMLDHFQSIYFLKSKYNNIERKLVKKDDIDLAHQVFLENYSEEYEDAWKLTKTLINEIASISKQNEADFLMMVIPSVDTINIDRWNEMVTQSKAMQNAKFDLEKPHKILKEYCNTIPIDCIDLLTEFEGKEDYYYYKDGHWNEKGHKLTANILYKKIVESKNGKSN